jgi:hypothetical protein
VVLPPPFMLGNRVLPGWPSIPTLTVILIREPEFRQLEAHSKAGLESTGQQVATSTGVLMLQVLVQKLECHLTMKMRVGWRQSTGLGPLPSRCEALVPSPAPHTPPKTLDFLCMKCPVYTNLRRKKAGKW